MDKKAAAAEIKRLRAQAKDKSIPQEARNEMLDRANAIELEFYDKAVKGGETMAKGGAVKKKGYMYGGDATKMNGMHKMPDGSMMKDSAMAKGGAVKKKPAAKKTASRQSPVIAVMIGMTDKKKPAKKMAKGGYANCGASVKAAGGKK
jgi:phosphotransferase system IIB component